MTNIFMATAKKKVRGLSTFGLVETGAGILPFGALRINSKVLTENGYKPIEELTLNDKVLTKKGTFQRIINIDRKMYSGTLYSIRVKYHPYPIICTADQRFLVRTKNEAGYGAPTSKRVSELTTRDFIGMVINNETIIPEFNVELKRRKIKPTVQLQESKMWWVLGYFVGDGWVLDTKKKDGRLDYRIEFVINNRDEDIVLPNIRQILPISLYREKSGCKLFKCRNALWFSILKLFGKYAHGKKIPEFVQAFIEGYENADGYYGPKGLPRFPLIWLLGFNDYTLK